jgi:pilus assembly protein CpaE
MEKIIKVVIADNELGEREKLKQMLASAADIRVVGEGRDGKECLDVVTRLRPHIVLLKEHLPVISGLDVAEHISFEMPQIGVVLVLTGHEGSDVWHKMLRAGIKEFLTQPFTADQLVEELRKVAAHQARIAKKVGAAAAAAVAEAEAPKSRVVAVTGPRGGVGKTTIATNLAVLLASTSDKVALVDFNLWGGDIAMQLDLSPRRTLGDLLPGFGGIDFDVLDSLLSKHKSGLSVLASPPPGAFDGTTLSRYLVQSIVDAMRGHFDTIILDTGYANLESTLAAMDAADVILVVVGMDLPRLRDAKHYLKNLLAANYPQQKIRVAVNRADRSKEIRPAEVESILEFPVAVQLPDDEALVTSAINLGAPFVLNHPHKPLSKSLQTLAESIGAAPASEAAVKPPQGAKSWFSFLQ